MTLTRRQAMKMGVAGLAGLALSPTNSYGRYFRILEENKKRGMAPEDAVWLVFNVNPLGSSNKAYDVMRRSVRLSHHYGEYHGYELLRNLHEMHGLKFSDMENPDSYFARYAAFNQNPIMLGFGGTEFLQAIARHANDQGGNYVEIQPTYGEITGTINRLPKVRIERRSVHETVGHEASPEEILAKTDRNTRLIHIINPSNPTGRVYSPEALVYLMDNKPPETLLLIDEAYIHYAPSNRVKSMIGEAVSRENVVVLRTMSKAYGLAAKRVGYIVGNPETFKSMALRPMGGYYQNPVAMLMAKEALGDKKFVEKSVNHANSVKARYLDYFAELGLRPRPSATSFMWVHTDRDLSGVVRELEKENIFIKSGHQYGEPNHIRVSIGTNRQVNRFFNIFRDKMKG
ncbi:histidinol-phosphate aminotransferase [Fulvitalea axinellae]|uniref:Histidinol-phosphate aminotransferase n=1 Tax=Fulvitalea axinellae TaxID=1182444 RepID=A0AAU9CPV5_9BACT|nr:histidinol-phosphate aminotransferase [Fulvitalea axinellae]